MPLLGPEGQHSAPAPQTLGKPREEDRVKRRRAEHVAERGEPRSRTELEKSLKAWAVGFAVAVVSGYQARSYLRN